MLNEDILMAKVLSQVQRWVVLIIASTGVLIGSAAVAQTAPGTEATDSTEAVESPEAAPEAATPAAEVTSEELEQFASVIPDLQTIQADAQAEVATAVEDSGLSAERFNQIAQAQASPEAVGEVEISSEEATAFEAIVTEIQQIEQDFLTQRQAILESQGLTVERYQEILAAVQEDPALLEQVESLL